MKRYGYTTTLARNGQEAVELFSRAPDSFHLVLLDLTLPAMKGDEVFQRLQSIRPGVPVLLMSGYLSNTATRNFTGKGLMGFIQKPFTALEFAEKLKAVLKPGR